MVISPLGAILMDSLKITPSHFGLVVSVYAFSAGASGLITAGFADKFDRKKLILFFYFGFMFGTVLCAIAENFHFLVIARTITGLFGGVISSIGLAIVTDLFPMEVRGRVMGFVQMAFAASQVFGIPIGLVLANKWGWHAPFWMIAGGGMFIGVIMLIFMRPITDHLHAQTRQSAIRHLGKTISRPPYLLSFLTTTLMSTGMFMLAPFGSAFSIHNLGLTFEQLPTLYGITGVFSAIIGPIVGRISDTFGKFRIFWIGSIAGSFMVAIYTHLGLTPLWLVIVVSVLLYTTISSRVISGMALLTAVPDRGDIGAFMSVVSSVRQIAGGVSSVIAGLIVGQAASGLILNYGILGYVVIGSMLLAIVLMYFIDQFVNSKQKAN
ncbi:MAG: MFS transporter [Deferribacteres bacterium]|nr:MFS transporter [candidate division KSB1 bacterium]MCB9501179.1 MFS transporter [Deferribacteres bacterium]